MIKRKRKRKVKRWFILSAIAAFIFLCIFIAKLLLPGPADILDIPVIKQTDTARDTELNKKFTVCIDPGHGEFDTGSASISGILEKDINLSTALKAGKLLEKSGYRIVYTRTSDDVKGSTQKEDLKLRCDMSNEADADIFVSIHCNFDKHSKKSKGLEIWCRLPGQKGEELAKSLEKRLSEADYTKNRGVKYESDGELYVLKNTRAIAALVELGFLSNADDCSFLNSDEGQEKCAKAIAQAVIDYASNNTNTENK